MNRLVKFDAGVGLWAAKKETLDRVEFGKAMLLLAGAQGRPFDEAGAAAFWLALADQTTEDFVLGVHHTLKHARFITPAIVVEACDEARRERLEQERYVRDADDPERAEWRRRYFEFLEKLRGEATAQREGGAAR